MSLGHWPLKSINIYGLDSDLSPDAASKGPLLKGCFNQIKPHSLVYNVWSCIYRGLYRYIDPKWAKHAVPKRGEEMCWECMVPSNVRLGTTKDDHNLEFCKILFFCSLTFLKLTLNFFSAAIKHIWRHLKKPIHPYLNLKLEFMYWDFISIFGEKWWRKKPNPKM